MDTDNLYHVEQAHYTNQCLEKCEHYSGRADKWDEDEANEALSELIGYFGLHELPPPPRGLPGANNLEAKASVMEVINLSMAYFNALVSGEVRRQINAYKDVQQALNRSYRRGLDDCERGYAEAFAKRCEEQMAELELARAKPAPACPVYFIGGETGPIKIGISTNVRSRLSALQTSNPIKLSVLALAEGGREQETAYHAQFAARREAGEWFQRCPEIEAEIDRLNSEGAV